jgi:transposase-like protein
VAISSAARVSGRPLHSNGSAGRRLDNVFHGLAHAGHGFPGFAHSYYLAGMLGAPVPSLIVHIRGAAFSGNNLLDSQDESAYTLFVGNINSKIPKGLQRAIEHFSDPRVCFETAKQAKWGAKGPECPQCGDKRLSFIKTRMMWTCLECRKQFSVKVGTIFEDSSIPLKKWFCAMWLVANCKNGVSSYEIARVINVTQQTAWFMDHRIRYAMHYGTIKQDDWRSRGRRNSHRRQGSLHAQGSARQDARKK